MRLLAIAPCLAACGEPAVVVEIVSDLGIPRETNSLVARVDDGTAVVEETYALGDPPRDGWPQTLPILAGTGRERATVAAELRISASGMPSVVVGYGEREIHFPRSGYDTVRLEVPRSCIDSDGDGFGIGFGCKRPDCDDTNGTVPAEAFCPGYGVVDAGVADAGPPPDAGPSDGGLPDTGAPDSGVEACGGDICQPDETCLNQQCLLRCETTLDCGEIHLACLEQFGVCICRVPCFNVDDCGPYVCVDGCCEL